MPLSNYARNVNRILIAVLVAKLGLVVAQAYGARASGSLALTADALNSFFDAGTVMVGLIILRLASRPADDDHPFGHRKFETVSALVIAGLLFLTSFEVGRLAVERLISGAPVLVLSPFTYGVVALSLVVNLVIMVVERRASVRLGSDVLAADAGNARGDVAIHVSVLASFVLVRFGNVWADPLIAVAAAGIIAFEGWRISSAAFHILVDRVVYPPEDVARVVESIPGVVDVHDIRSTGHPGAALVSMHLVVRPDDVLGAHAITETVEESVRTILGAHEVVIHVEPSTDAL